MDNKAERLEERVTLYRIEIEHRPYLRGHRKAYLRARPKRKSFY